MRRSLILDAYHRTGHCSGMYTHRASILLEENIFDHNGWLLQGKPTRTSSQGASAGEGGATLFNHNTYFCGARDTVFRGNMFLRASSMGNKWTANEGPASTRNITIDDNLYVEGEIGIGMGGNVAGPLRFKDVKITNNVLMHIGRDRPTNRELGWYIEILDWDGGLVSGNLLLHQQNEKVRNVFGINMSYHGETQEGGPHKAVGEHSRNIKIQDNIVYGLLNGYGVTFNKCQNLSNVSFTGNLIQFPDLTTRVLLMDALTTNVAFANNKYFSGEESDAWFKLNEKDVDFKAWTKDSGDTGSTEE